MGAGGGSSVTDQYEIVRIQAPTAGTPGVTTSDITHPRITETCKGAVFFAGGISGTGTANHMRTCVGFCDDGNGGTKRSASIARRVETQASAGYDSITWPTLGDDPLGACIVVGDESTTGEDAVARVDSFIAGGVRVVWDTIPATAFEVVVLLIAGVSNVKVFLAGQANEEDPGFQPDWVLFANFITSLGTSPVGQADACIGLGAAVSTPALQQTTVYGRMDRLSDPSDADAVVRNAVAFGDLTGSGTPTDETYTITSFDSSGFNATLSGTPQAVAIAVKGSNPTPQAKYSTVIEPITSGMSGNVLFSSMGIRPKVVIGCASLVNADNTLTDGATAATETLFMFDDSVEYCVGGSAEEGVAAVDAFTVFDTKALRLLTHTGTDAAVATRTSLGNGGFSLNFTTASDGRLMVLGIGAMPGVPIPKPKKPQPRRKRQKQPRRPPQTFGKAAAGFVSIVKHIVRQRVQQILRRRQPRKMVFPAPEVERVTDQDPEGTIMEGNAVRAVVLEGGAEEGTLL